MDTIIGLGSAGCKIADEFSKYSQYEIYKIDTSIQGENCYDFPKQNKPEDYETNCPDMGAFFHNIEGDVLFVVSGSGMIANATLSILKQLKNCNINILFIKPSNDDLSSIGAVQNKVIFNVLQQYARSGIFNKIYLVDNESLEETVGDIPLLEYFNKINESLVDVIHYINIFKNTTPVLDNYEPPSDTARIVTFGIHDMETSEEKYFFPIAIEKNKTYYFAINENSLKTDGRLLRTIREKVNNGEIQTSYEIHSTKHEKSFCFFLSFSNVIQQLDN